MTAPVLTDADSVLVVDDEQFSRQIVGRILRDIGNPEIVYAKNGSEAIGAMMAPNAHFKAIVSDFNMPVKNGLELLKAIRTSTSFIRHDIPFVMLTGIADRAVVGAAMALDTDSFVVKPVSKAALESRLSRALSEPRDLKSPKEYAEIDITEATAGLLSHEPAGQARKTEHKTEAAPVNGQRLSLLAVKPGAVLAQEIRGPGGELLLASGVTLSSRLIERLKDMATLKMPIESVWVQR